MRTILRNILLPFAALLCTMPLCHGQDRYSVSLGGMYGWNGTFLNQGGFDIASHMPIHKNYEMDAAFEYHSPSVCSITANCKPLIPLSVGQLFFDASLNGRFLCTYNICELTTALSFGYRMDYVSAQFGFTSRFILDMQRGGNNVCEPFNFLYRVAVSVRPSTCRWNLYIGVSSFTEYQYERMTQPIFLLGGHYDINDNYTVLLTADSINSGLTHMTAHFWSVSVRAGVKYRF